MERKYIHKKVNSEYFTFVFLFFMKNLNLCDCEWNCYESEISKTALLFVLCMSW